MKNGKTAHSWKILLIFILITIFLRAPFFFRDYIDHDESTFILMGQAIIDGYLPYLKLWDLKPPLVFYFFAGIISVFGKSLLAIRFIGCIIVGLTGWFTYKLSQEFFSRKISIIAGILCIYLMSLFGAMQGLMSEHLAILPLLIGMYILIKKQTSKSLFIAGILFGLAMMFRLNLAYAVLLIQLYIVFENKEILKGIQRAFSMGLGILFLIFLVILPYIITGNFDILKSSIVDASLAYSDANFTQMLSTLPVVLGLIIICGLSLKWLYNKQNSSQFLFLIIMVFGQSFMFFKAGKVNGHYLIQVFPFLVILIVALLSKIPLKPQLQRKLLSFLMVLALLTPVETYLEWKNVVDSKIETGHWENGEGISIPRYLKENYTKREYDDIFFLNEHIGYWVLHTEPPTAISTHPSNIFRPAAHAFVGSSQGSPYNELKFILEQHPNFIVFDQRRNPIPKKSRLFQLFQNTLKSDYILEKEFGNQAQVKLYKSKKL